MSTEYDEEEMGESGPGTTQNYKLCSNFWVVLNKNENSGFFYVVNEVK